MKARTIVAAFAVTTGLLMTGAAAQQNQAPAADSSGKMGDMMPRMHQMMMGQNDTGKLVEQLLSSLAAIENEKDPVALKEKLAEHESLLKELQAKLQAQFHRMDMMQHMMGGGMMGSEMKK